LERRPLFQQRGKPKQTEWTNVNSVIFYQEEKAVELEIPGPYPPSPVIIKDVDFLDLQELRINGGGAYTAPSNPQPYIQIYARESETFNVEHDPVNNRVIVRMD